MRIRALRWSLALGVSFGCSGPTQVQFPTEDGGVVHAELLGGGDRGVVLAHGGRFDHSSWADTMTYLRRLGGVEDHCWGQVADAIGA